MSRDILNLIKMSNTEIKAGLFIACYEIGGDKAGAPTFKVNLSVYTPEKTVSGIGVIDQAVNPPLHITSSLHGTFTYMCVMPKNCHIQVRLTGHPVISWHQINGIGPVIPANVEFIMVLTEDWKSGSANYSYLDKNGKWHEIENAPVKLVQGNNIA